VANKIDESIGFVFVVTIEIHFSCSKFLWA